MRFVSAVPIVTELKNVNNYNTFSRNGCSEFCSFLKHLLGLDEVKIQGDLKKLRAFLGVKDLQDVMDVPGVDNAICVVSQIYTNGNLIAYFPYLLRGWNVKDYLHVKSFLSKLAEAVSDQITLCYLNGFSGTDFLFGESLAKLIVSNCISARNFESFKFAHLIEKMEQLSSTTFEGTFFNTGVIVCNDASKYKKNFFEFNELKKSYKEIDELNKRDWFLANGSESFYLLDNSIQANGICIRSKTVEEDFIKRYFDDYYFEELKAPDFVVRVVAPNEIAVSDSDGKEFVRIENVWRYRYRKNFNKYLEKYLSIDDNVSNAILYYTLYCSRNRISSIIWIPNDCTKRNIKKYTLKISDPIWKRKLSILEENHKALVEKVLASDGAVVVNKKGQIIYESVFAKMKRRSSGSKTTGLGVATTATGGKLAGTGATAAEILSEDGIAIKISQDGTIKIIRDKKIIYY